MLSVETIAAVAALVTAGGGAFAGIGAWLQRRKDAARQGEESEIGRLRTDVAALKQDVAAEREKHAVCEAALEALEERLAAVEQHHPSLMARWIKDANKRLIWINARAMIQIFAPLGFARDEIEGRTFAEIGLDASVTTEVDRLDRAALTRSGEAASTLLVFRRGEPPAGAMAELPAMMVVKVAGIGRDGDLIFEGYAFKGNDKEAVLDLGERRQAEQLGASRLRVAAADNERSE